MWWETAVIAAIPFASSLLAVVLGRYIWQKRQKPIGRAVLCLVGACGVWSFFYGLELVLPSIQLKTLAAQCQYAGIVFVAPSWCIASLYSAGLGRYLSRPRIAALIAIPVVTLLAAATNAFHGMLWKRIWIAPDGLPLLRFEYGPLFWINNQYAWLLLLVGTVLLLRNVLSRQSLYVGQRVFMVLTIVVPWLANAAYILDSGPIPGLDLTPFAFVVSALFLFLGLFRYRISEVVPVAREYVVENSDECLFVLNADGTIIDMNHAALELLGAIPIHAIGKTTGEAFATIPALKRISVCADGVTARFKLERSNERSTYVAHVTTIRSKYGMPICRIITCWNISSEIAAATALREHAERYKELFDESPIALWQEDFSEVRRYFEKLRESGVTDFDRYFLDNPDEIEKCARAVKLLDVNRAAIVQHGASNKEELLENLSRIFTPQALDVFRKELSALADGQTTFSAEAEHRSLAGDVFWVSVNVRVLPGHEELLDCVLVSNIDITTRKIAEDEGLRLRTELAFLHSAQGQH